MASAPVLPSPVLVGLIPLAERGQQSLSNIWSRSQRWGAGGVISPSGRFSSSNLSAIFCSCLLEILNGLSTSATVSSFMVVPLSPLCWWVSAYQFWSLLSERFSLSCRRYPCVGLYAPKKNWVGSQRASAGNVSHPMDGWSSPDQ